MVTISTSNCACANFKNRKVASGKTREGKQEDLRETSHIYLMKKNMSPRALPAQVRVDLSYNIEGYCTHINCDALRADPHSKGKPGS